MVRISLTGRITYGYGQVAVDGAVPAPLVGHAGFYPAWMSNTQLVWHEGGVGGAGPWNLSRLTYPSETVDIVSSYGANFVWAGGGIWAAWLGSDGFARTSDPDLGPWPGAFIADVSAEGRVVRIDAYHGGGLTIFSSANGTVLYAKPFLLLGLDYICRLRGNLLSYLDDSGRWHIIDIDTGLEANWAPRLDGVNWMIPVVHNNTLYVMERTGILTIREATRQDAWVLRDIPDTFNPDVRSVGSLIRVATCTNIGESPDSLLVFNVIPSQATGTIAVETGTVVGGTIVYSLPQTIQPITVQVGETVGEADVKHIDLPYRHPFISTDGEAAKKGIISRPWEIALQRLEASIQAVSRTVASSPVPIPVPPSSSGSTDSGFNEVTSPGQPSVMATPGARKLDLRSSDSSVQFQLVPGPQIIDITAIGGGGGDDGPCCEPLTNGDAEWAELIFADGDVIMVDPPTGS